MAVKWSRTENEAIVSDYFEMLEMVLTGAPFVKAHRVRALLGRLPGRSKQSIEFKYANISAVLDQHGQAYVPGYEPRGHFQKDLEHVVEDVIVQNGVAARLARSAELPPPSPQTDNWATREEDPPTRLTDRTDEDPGGVRRGPIRIDYLEREASRRDLGLAGEEWVLRFEHARLLSLGAKNLADRIEHVSKEQGDGLGYDILSYEADGRERLIEVKTTASGYMSPFFVSKRELEVSRERRDEYQLYRVFAFRSDPKLYRRPGPIDVGFALTPTQFRARPGM